MRVHVEVMGHLADLLPGGAVDVPPGSTVGDLLLRLAGEYPGFRELAFSAGRFTGGIQVVLGDRLLDLAGGLERRLVEGDLLTILPPFAGG